MKKQFVMSCLLSISFKISAATLYPGAVMGRDLLIHGLGWAGHVGIASALYVNQAATDVYEVLHDTFPVQLNPIKRFQSMSNYWGSRTGILPVGSNVTGYLLREADRQRVLNCAEYTTEPFFKPGNGYLMRDGNVKCTSTGYFRCDTFLQYLFLFAGVNVPYARPILPTSFFKAFPKGNQDGKYAHASMADNTNDVTKVENPYKSLKKLINAKPMDMISEEHPLEKYYAKRLLRWSESPLLSETKQNLLIEKAGFLGDASTIPDFINLYEKTDPIKDIKKREHILSSMHFAYQEDHCFDEEKPICQKMKKRLAGFYLKLLNTKEDNDAGIIKLMVRGLLNFEDQETLLKNHLKIKNAINEAEDMPAELNLILKREMMAVIDGVKSEYLDEILSLIEKEENIWLESNFNYHIVASMIASKQHVFSKEDLVKVKAYLSRIAYKYVDPEESQKFVHNGNMFSFGSWLEATALVNTTNFKEAGQYIADFLEKKPSMREQEYFVIGLSNSHYLQSAFDAIPVLVQFKQANPELYNGSVGIDANSNLMYGGH